MTSIKYRRWFETLQDAGRALNDRVHFYGGAHTVDLKYFVESS
ncbi:hypothetical protein [Pollutimonas subterranea]|nr:hypothetical protein [Pollutimonas subterranea]